MLETNTAGNVSADQRYRAYGRQRHNGPVVTDHRFTGQKDDGTGLYYYNARYYDPEIGVFISPDTIVPDATNLLDYNRYSYVRGNPLKYNDPSGHCGTLAVTGGTSAPLDVACWIAMAEAAAAVAAVGTGAVGAGAFLAAGLYGYEQTTFELPDYDHAYDIPGTDLQASSIVNGSSTVRSGVPVLDVGTEGFTLLDPPQLEELVVPAKWLGENERITGIGDSGRLRGYIEATSGLHGGLIGAQEAFEGLTGRTPRMDNSQSKQPTDSYIELGKIEVYFRPTSRSGTPVLEIIDHGSKTNEKIHFN